MKNNAETPIIFTISFKKIILKPQKYSLRRVTDCLSKLPVFVDKTKIASWAKSAKR